MNHITSHNMSNDNIDSKGENIKFIECKAVFPSEQKECKKELYGSKDQLLIHDDHEELSIQTKKSLYGLD